MLEILILQPMAILNYLAMMYCQPIRLHRPLVVVLWDKGMRGKLLLTLGGNYQLVNDGNISGKIYKTAVGNGQGIKISARELEIANQSYISSLTFQNTQVNGKGNAGDIDIKTTGDIRVSGFALPSTTPTLSYISSDTQGYGDTGKVTIDTQGKLSVVNYGKY